MAFTVGAVIAAKTQFTFIDTAVTKRQVTARTAVKFSKAKNSPSFASQTTLKKFSTHNFYTSLSDLRFAIWVLSLPLSCKDVQFLLRNRD